MNPFYLEREAYAVAYDSIQHMLWENRLRRKYSHLSPEQYSELEKHYRTILANMEAHIVELDHQHDKHVEASA